MSRSTHKRGLLSLLGMLLAFTLVAAACGSDDDDSTTSSDSTTTAAPADATTAAPADEPADEPADATTAAPADEPADSGDSEVRIGILGECEGTFGAEHENVVAGASLAIINASGATSESATTSLDGFTTGEIAGVPVSLVSVGCGDETPDKAVAEIRRIVEQDGANVVIGPLSGDEGIAIANYAKDHPEVTFINGISGGQDATLHVQAPNFFRFNNDGAQWNAGIGDILHNEAGWDTAAVIMDDYSFGWTSAAGFIADFCGVGGEVVSRVYAPLGTTDYSSFVQQLPDIDEVDGYFWVVGGSGTVPAMNAFVDAKGDIDGAQHSGNLFLGPGLGADLGTGIAGAYIGGFATPPGDIVGTPQLEAYLATADVAWETLNDGVPSASAATGFFYGFYVNALAFTTAFEQVGGDLSDNHAALRDALSNLELDAPYGPVKLDGNRQAITDTWVQQLVENDAGEIVAQTVAIIPDVDQTFGGTFSADTAPPGRDEPPCAPADLPWAGNAIPVVDGVAQE
jgi:branched-chain amino acid transport system substrate-binding protein